MKLFTSLFVLLFSLCAVVSGLHAEEDEPALLAISAKSALCGGPCVFFYPNEQPERCSGCIRVLKIYLVPRVLVERWGAEAITEFITEQAENEVEQAGQFFAEKTGGIWTEMGTVFETAINWKFDSLAFPKQWNWDEAGLSVVSTAGPDERIIWLMPIEEREEK